MIAESSLSVRGLLPRYEVAYQSRDFIGSRIQRKMTAVHNVNLSVRDILAIRFRLRGIERGFIFAPDHQQTRLLLAHPRLPLRVGVHVGAIVVEQIGLNVQPGRVG